MGYFLIDARSKPARHLVEGLPLSYETKEKELKETFGKWDKLKLKSKYKEIHFQLKIQRTRWEFLISNIPNQAPNPG